MIVMLELEHRNQAAVNPAHVVCIDNQTGNQFGTKFCCLTLSTGKVLSVMSTIEKTMQALNIAMERTDAI